MRALLLHLSNALTPMFMFSVFSFAQSSVSKQVSKHPNSLFLAVELEVDSHSISLSVDWTSDGAHVFALPSCGTCFLQGCYGPCGDDQSELASSRFGSRSHVLSDRLPWMPCGVC